MTFPRITIVTPSFNQAKYLERTILSVLNQNYPNLEYIVIDGGSTDGSLDIIKKYERYLTYWESNKDEGQYHAIQKGFEKSTGDIMAWINSDDIYHTKSLFIVAEIFEKFQEVKWLTGNISFIDKADKIVRAYSTRRWSRINLLNGDYGWIQQESTFWRRELWQKAGGSFNFKYSLAADFELWMRFFRFGSLYTTEALLGAFRVRKQDQKTLEQLDFYLKELHEVIRTEKITVEESKKMSYISFYEKYLSKIPLLKRFSFLKERYNSCYSYPPMICFDRNSYSYILKN